jgi:hypothetical protein
MKCLRGPLIGWLLGGAVLLGGPLAGLAAQTPPAASQPLPNGSSLRWWASKQAERAAADEFVIYKCEWHLGGTLPTQTGFTHLERIARRIQGTRYCVIIQPDTNIPVNELRRKQVVKFLTDYGVADAGHRVLLAHPEAEGLNGDEAERLFSQHPQSSR